MKIVAALFCFAAIVVAGAASTSSCPSQNVCAGTLCCDSPPQCCWNYNQKTAQCCPKNKLCAGPATGECVDGCNRTNGVAVRSGKVLQTIMVGLENSCCIHCSQQVNCVGAVFNTTRHRSDYLCTLFSEIGATATNQVGVVFFKPSRSL
jgi:hypothetical protein